MNCKLLAAVAVVAAVSTTSAQTRSEMIQLAGRSDAGLTISAALPRAEAIVRSNDPGDFVQIEHPDGRSVPAVVQWIAVPEGSVAELEFGSRESYFTSGDGGEEASFDESLPIGSLWPPAPAIVGRVEVVRGIPVAPLTIYKAQLDEAGGAVENVRVDLNVRFRRSLVAPRVRTFTEASFTETARFVRSLLLNPPPRDLDVEEQIPYLDHILILYSSTLNENLGVAWIDSLASWKRRIGYKVSTRSVNFGEMSPIEIREAVRGVYYFDRPDPIGHLILIGGMESGEAVYFPSQPGPENGRGDHGWGIMDEEEGPGLLGEMVSDITVGRFYVNSYQELAGAVNRSVFYEAYPYVEGGREWFRHALFTAENILAAGGQYVPSMVHLGRWVYHRLSQMGYDPIDTMYTGSHPDSVAAVVRRTEEILENEGVTLAISRGWLTGCYDFNSNSFANTGRRNPFVIAVTCLSGATQARFFRDVNAANRRGSIASLSIFGLTHSRTNNGLMGGMIRAMRDYGMHQPGYIMNYSKWQLWNDYQYDNVVDVEKMALLWWYHLLGDPTVRFLDRYPDSLAVTHRATLPAGATGLEVTVRSGGAPVADAVVCVSQGNNIHFVAAPGDDGVVRFSFEPGELQQGSLQVTVSGQNLIPYLGAVSVEAAGQAGRIVLGDIAFPDGESFPAGDTTALTLTFSNAGNSAVNNPRLILVSESPWVAFLPNDTISFNSVDARSSRDVPIRLKVNRSAPFGSRIIVSARVESGNNSWSDAFEVTTSGPDLQVARFELSGGDEPERGVTSQFRIHLINRGDLGSPALRVRVENHGNPHLTIPDADCRLGAAAVNEEPNIEDGIAIRSDSLFVPGQDVTLRLILSAIDNNDSFRDTLEYTMTVGSRRESDPTGPDSYGYHCFDNLDATWSKSQSFSWREINPNIIGYEFRGTRADMNDVWEDFDANVVVRLPFTFRFYGEDFDTLVISSNGWIAFGADQSPALDFRNQQIPGVQGPDAMVAVFWDDVISRVDGSGVYYHYVEEENVFIVEWSLCEIYGDNNFNDQDFQVILYNPARWLTSTGDGDIKCQYKSIANVTGAATDNFYATIGIKSPDGLDGMTYNYWHTAWPGARVIQDDMALVFSTDLQVITGSVSGRAVLFENQNQGLAGASVQCSGGQRAVTDAQGNFTISRIPIGSYTITVRKPGYTDEFVRNVAVAEGRETRITVLMKHPELVAPQGSIRQDLQPGRNQNTQTMRIGNSGNGTLNYRVVLRDTSGASASYPRVLTINGRDIENSDATAIRGVEFVEDAIYVSSGGAITQQDNRLVRLDRHGGNPQFFPQRRRSSYGYGDLAYDGEYLYAGEDSLLLKIRLNGDLVDSTVIAPWRETADKIPYGLAWNPVRKTLLVATQSSQVLEVSTADTSFGEPLGVIPFSLPPGYSLKITGLAYNAGDEDGMPVYAVMSSTAPDGRKMWLAKTNGDETKIVRQLAQDQQEDGTGLGIGFDWDTGRAVLATIANRNRAIDTIRVYDAGPDARGISFSRAWQVAEAEATADFPLTFHSDGLQEGAYDFSLVIFHNAASDSVRVPVRLVIDRNADVDFPDDALPSGFALSEPYPNPFNASTRFSYTLPSSGRVKLAVYDLAGRQAAMLFDGVQDAGDHSGILQAGDIPAGLYFLRMSAGGEQHIRRLVVVK